MKLTKALNLLFASLLMAACTKPGGASAGNGNQDVGAIPPGASAPKTQGTASGGGGGYGNESGMRLLEMSKTELTRMLKQASPEIFENLKKDVKAKNNKNAQEELIRLVSNIKSMPDKDAVRDGIRLKFDYAEPQGTDSYIYATQLYFDSTASIPLDYTSFDNQRVLIQDNELKMLHEALHVLGYGRTQGTDLQARELARRVTRALWSDEMLCTGKGVNSFSSSQDQDDSGVDFWINIASGYALVYEESKMQSPSVTMDPTVLYRNALESTISNAGDARSLKNATDLGPLTKPTTYLRGLNTRSELQGSPIGFNHVTGVYNSGLMNYNDFQTVQRDQNQLTLKYDGSFCDTPLMNGFEGSICDMSQSEKMTIDLKKNDDGTYKAFDKAGLTNGPPVMGKRAVELKCRHSFEVINVDDLSKPEEK